jgi:replication fork clamp-binding protein CrfC
MIEKVSPPREISNSKHVSLLYDEDSKILIQIWKDFVPSKAFREAIDKSVAFTEDNLVKGILSNALDQGVVSAEDAKYAADTIPRMYKNGFRPYFIDILFNSLYYFR